MLEPSWAASFESCGDDLSFRIWIWPCWFSSCSIAWLIQLESTYGVVCVAVKWNFEKMILVRKWTLCLIEEACYCGPIQETVGCAASGGFGIRDWSRCWKQVQENIWRRHQPFYCILEEGCCSSFVLFSHPINFRKLWNCALQVILFQKHPAKHTWRSIFFSFELGLCTLVKDYDRMLLMQCSCTWFISTLWILQEKDRRYKELGIRDKITLTSGRFFLGNK